MNGFKDNSKFFWHEILSLTRNYKIPLTGLAELAIKNALLRKKRFKRKEEPNEVKELVYTLFPATKDTKLFREQLAITMKTGNCDDTLEAIRPVFEIVGLGHNPVPSLSTIKTCLLYTSDAADE